MQVLVWQGKVAIVPFLHSPGFCTVRSKDGTSFPSLVETSALLDRLPFTLDKRGHDFSPFTGKAMGQCALGC